MSNLLWSLSGIGGLLATKYCLVGLNLWNATLHPGRIEPPHLARFAAPLFGLSARDAIRVWLGVAVIANSVVGYEIAAENGVWGLHTISWLSYQHQWLGYALFFAMLGVAAWWLHHFHEEHPR